MQCKGNLFKGEFGNPEFEHKSIAGWVCNMQLVSKTNRYWDHNEI